MQVVGKEGALEGWGGGKHSGMDGCNTRDRSITHSLQRKIKKMSFDQIFDLTA